MPSSLTSADVHGDDKLPPCVCDLAMVSRSPIIRTACIYRSSAVVLTATPVTPPRWAVAVDFRTAFERGVTMSTKPCIANGLLHLPMPESTGIPISYMELLLRRELRTITEERIAADYLELVKTSRNSLRAFFTMLADRASFPIIFFCAKGRDRTGIAAALLLALMDCHRDDILANYECASTAEVTIPLLDAESYRRAGISYSAYKLAYVTSGRSMEIFLDRVALEHGNVHGFMSSFLGLAPATLDVIKSNLRS